MAWVVTPPTQTQESKTGWVTSPTTTSAPPQQGWVGSGTGKITARVLSGNGQLTVTTMVRPFVAMLVAGDGVLVADLLKREYRNGALVGEGELRADYSQIHPAAPQFNSTGLLSADTVSTHLEPQFGGEGTLSANSDGLRATVVPGLSIDVFFSGEGNLPAPLSPAYYLFAEFTGQGMLTGPLVPKLVAALAGNGTLSATRTAQYLRAAALLASGTLSATDFAAYLRSIGFTGAGALTNLLQVLFTPAAGGTGTVSALVKQIYANAPALSGGGSLSAEAFGGMLPYLTGLGTLSGTGLANYLRSVGLSGVGALAGAGFPAYQRPTSLTGTGTTVAQTMQKYDLDYLGGVGVSDNFNRADNATTPGPGWGGRWGVCGTQSNQFYPVNEGWNGVSFDSYPMSTDDHEASVVWGDVVGDGSGDLTIVIIGANGTGAGAAGYFTAGGIGYISKTDDWTLSTGAILATAQYDDPKPFYYGAGDRIGIRRVGNTYFLTKNGQVHSDRGVYLDSPQVIPRGAAYRTVALYQYRSGANYRRLENFEAKDVTSVPFTGGGALSATATQVPYPTITNVTPGTDYAGDTITVTGTGFIAPVSVTVGGVAATSITVGSSTSLTCVVPSVGFGQQYVQVGTAAGLSNGYPITVADPFFIGTVSPSSGAYDTAVTITGNGFTGTTSVTINGVAVRNLSVVNNTTITCNPPGLANGTYNVAVTAPLGSETKTSAFTYSYTPVSETNTDRSSVAVPTGSQGAWVTLIGSGGGGNKGHYAFSSNRGGGGGGGGGGKVERVWVSRSLMGSTYSVVHPVGGTGGASGLSATDGAAATFVSGSVSLSAGGGLQGGLGTSGAVGAGGAGGTSTASGVTATLRNGSAGGAGGGVSGGTGVAAANNTTGGAPGGGGGGGLSSIGAKGGGAKGGDSATVAGGAGASSSGQDGGTGVNAAAGNAGSGGGGAGHASATTYGYIGGVGGTGGGGGGGGSASNTSGASFEGKGGYGGAGYTLLEWV